MSHTTRQLALFTAAWVCVVIGSITIASCTKNTRMDTLQASIIVVDAARDGFIAWDRQTSHAIIEQAKTREEAEKALAIHVKQVNETVHTFELVYKALAVAATQTDDPSLKSALAASSQLVDLINKLTEKH